MWVLFLEVMFSACVEVVVEEVNFSVVIEFWVVMEFSSSSSVSTECP